ncbi:retinol dehydrogenase 12 [Venturia nashicola]|uniref:Retinol dehydrogenase 12 n=1 Tax=Venturia nashicola TaxID=86259 RepID=A0A4Z1NS26_9PEZI|nr:retinol dehydrogenase 12 [Venturia nashicola]TLD18733.1 retinol dehydrogenase 12 [Venturia nashicola]
MFGFGAATFSTADIPDLSGKVILVTGGNSGLGLSTILELAKHNPTQIYLAARSKPKAQTALTEIKEKLPNAPVTFLELDLSDFASIKTAADVIKNATTRLDILMNNAGIMATPPGLTKNGYELQFGTNHMGHALLTTLLIPILQKTAKEHGEARIVNLSSTAHNWPPSGGLRLHECKTEMRDSSNMARYGQSKLANILFTKGLAKHYPDIKSVAVHPGVVNTTPLQNFNANLSWLAAPARFLTGLVTVEAAEGALTQLFAATSKEAKTGTYYVPIAEESAGSGYARDEKLMEALWDYTQKELEAAGY